MKSSDLSAPPIVRTIMSVYYYDLVTVVFGIIVGIIIARKFINIYRDTKYVRSYVPFWIIINVLIVITYTYLLYFLSPAVNGYKCPD